MKTSDSLRSARWFAPDDLRSFGHRSRFMQMGYSPEDWLGKPVIGIINTWSDINPCHAHFKQRVEDVKHGVLQAGGFPVELPALSLAEQYVKPTTMLYRNMLAMDTEELIRCHPIDGVVLMGGCDKTTPALMMGGTSAGVLIIYIPAGPACRLRCQPGRFRAYQPQGTRARQYPAKRRSISHGGLLLCGRHPWAHEPHQVREGDWITIDVAARAITLEVPDEELARRRADWKAPEPRYERGYGWLSSRHIQQADKGSDFDFLQTQFGVAAGEPDIF